MYDWPEIRAATDAWWTGLAARLGKEGFDVPPVLQRPGDLTGHWTSPDLLLSQTCGYPLTHALTGKVKLLAVPVYGVPGCEGTDYSSAIIVRDGDAAQSVNALKGRRAAYNTPDSMSGYLALRLAVAPHAGSSGGFFADVLKSGSHRASMRMVREGHADVAAIDCVSFALAGRYCPKETRGLRVLGWSPRVPALPYITRLGWQAEDIKRLQTAVERAATDPDMAEVRSSLLLDRLEFPSARIYDRITRLERACSAQLS